MSLALDFEILSDATVMVYLRFAGNIARAIQPLAQGSLPVEMSAIDRTPLLGWVP